MTRVDADFASAGTRCAAWHHTTTSDALATPAGRPCVVMAHGFGGTRDSGLEPYAERLAAAGADVLLFDYRCLGASDGEPRGLITIGRQLDDYRAAVAHARTLAGVDPDRIVLWGASLSGGHVLTIAAEDPRIAAVISMIPAVDGRAILRAGLKADGPAPAARLTAAGTKDAVAALRGGPPVRVAVAGAPGSAAVLTAPGALEGYLGIAGPTWSNEVCARVALEIGLLRPGRSVGDVGCPMLFQVADLDATVPPDSIVKAAFAGAGRARVRHYPCDHFDVFFPNAWATPAAEHQAEFLADVLGAAEAGQAAA